MPSETQNPACFINTGRLLPKHRPPNAHDGSDDPVDPLGACFFDGYRFPTVFTAVRRWLWSYWVLGSPTSRTVFKTLRTHHYLMLLGSGHRRVAAEKGRTSSSVPDVPAIRGALADRTRGLRLLSPSGPLQLP